MLLLLFSTLALIPLITFLVFLYNFFPQNTVKIPAPLLAPTSLILTIFIHIPTAAVLFFLLPDYCFNFSTAPAMIFEELRSNWHALVIFIFLLVWYCAFPAIIYFYSLRALKNCWVIHKKLRYRYPNRDDLPYKKRASFVEKAILHPIAVLTSYNDKLEEVMVDVRTTDGYLFSGKLNQFFCDGHSHIGISQTNILKFDLRKDDKPPSTYLVPNNGEMYFPSENVQDLHFWRLKRGTHAKIEIKNKDSAARFAWLCNMQYSFPHLDIAITAVKPKSTDPVTKKDIMAQLAKCGLTPKDVKVTFKNPK